MKGEK